MATLFCVGRPPEADIDRIVFTGNTDDNAATYLSVRSSKHITIENDDSTMSIDVSDIGNLIDALTEARRICIGEIDTDPTKPYLKG